MRDARDAAVAFDRLVQAPALRCGNGRCECTRPKPHHARLHCPAHGDEHASLDVDLKNGKLLVVCRAGCRQADVMARLRDLNLWGPPASAKPWIRNGVRPNGEQKRRITATSTADSV